jgi:hypothetical protein
MNNFNTDFIQSEKDAQRVKFIQWPLDDDDDEFRAGYPFTSIPETKVNGEVF